MTSNTPSKEKQFAHLPRHNPLHYFPAQANSLLDIGCNVGAALELARKLGVAKLYGIEINNLAVQKAKLRLQDTCGVEIYQGSADQLPFKDKQVEVALCSEVLEHVPEDLRPKVIQETHRVLLKDGLFIITVPARGLFHFLDPGNMRFLFPNAFSLASKLIGGLGREKGFENQKHSVVWHHHFTLKELENLLLSHFTIVHIRYRGCLLSPICNWLEWPFYRMNATQNIIYKIIRHVHEFDMLCDFGGKFGYNVLIVAKKDEKIDNFIP